MTEGATRRVGRPSVTAERRRQIVAAFIDLVSERELERVTLDDVAKAAGVKRVGLHHFVGTRDALIVAAVDELTRRYEVIFRMAVGESPTVEELVSLLFSDDWTRDQSAEDGVFDSLLAEAVRHLTARREITRAYDMMLDESASALRRECPAATTARIRDTAYVVLCLAEHRTVLQ